MALMEATDDYFSRVFALMADQKRRYGIYLNELTRIYRQIVPGYDSMQINMELTEQVFTLLAREQVAITDLEAFAQKKRDEIIDTLTASFRKPGI